MKLGQLVPLLALTVVLVIGLTAVIGIAFRVNVYDNWSDKRCDPYVVPIAGFFKPSTDRRTASQFAADNWRFCQKEYVQNALRVSASVPAALVSAESATVGIVQDIASISADIFFDVWKFCHDVYAGFMGRMATAATLFRNFMIRLHDIVGRIHASMVSIVFGLISVIVGFVNSVHVAIIVSIIIVGIMIALQIILFMLIWPISSLLASVAAMMNIVVISFAAAIAAASGEMFAGGVDGGMGVGACFVSTTRVCLANGSTQSIDSVPIGTPLATGGVVTGRHVFGLDIDSATNTNLYNLNGIHVTGDHLIYVNDAQIPVPVCTHPDAHNAHKQTTQTLWCLTTTDRKIPVLDMSNNIVMFADWEEISEDDTERQQLWLNEVWTTLNQRRPVPVPSLTNANAGFSPTASLLVRNKGLCKIADISIGDFVADLAHDGCVRWTQVVGRVVMEGDLKTDGVTIQSFDCVIAPGTWIRSDQNPEWQQINTWSGCSKLDIHVAVWHHLYTTSGTFFIVAPPSPGTADGSLLVRDASEVGLKNLSGLVEKIIIKPLDETKLT